MVRFDSQTRIRAVLELALMTVLTSMLVGCGGGSSFAVLTPTPPRSGGSDDSIQLTVDESFLEPAGMRLTTPSAPGLTIHLARFEECFSDGVIPSLEATSRRAFIHFRPLHIHHQAEYADLSRPIRETEASTTVEGTAIVLTLYEQHLGSCIDDIAFWIPQHEHDSLTPEHRLELRKTFYEYAQSQFFASSDRSDSDEGDDR